MTVGRVWGWRGRWVVGVVEVVGMTIEVEVIAMRIEIVIK